MELKTLGKKEHSLSLLEASVHKDEKSGNVYFLVKNGKDYSHLWLKNRRFKVEEFHKDPKDKEGDLYLCGVSDDPLSVKEYSLGQELTYSIAPSNKKGVIEIGQYLYGKKWCKDVYLELEAFTPATLIVKKTKDFHEENDSDFNYGRVVIHLDEEDNIIKITKDCSIGVDD